MNLPDNVTDAQLKHLLEVVEQHRQGRCNELLQDAQSEARQHVKQAFGEARGRMHQEVLDLRERYRQQLTAVKAQQQTRIRKQQQQTDQALLATLWQPLHEALLRRWQQPDTRRIWIQQLVRQATATLVSTDWEIEHPVSWPEQERTVLESQLNKKDSNLVVSFSACESFQTGLRINTEGACIDGTMEGLLRDKSRIEARLLAGIHEHRRAGD